MKSHTPSEAVTLLVGLRFYHLELGCPGGLLGSGDLVELHIANTHGKALIFQDQLNAGCFTPVCQELVLEASSAPFQITFVAPTHNVLSTATVAVSTIDQIDLERSTCCRLAFREANITLEYELWVEFDSSSLSDSKHQGTSTRLDALSLGCSRSIGQPSEKDLELFKLLGTSGSYEVSASSMERVARIAATTQLPHPSFRSVRVGPWFDGDSYTDEDVKLRFLLDRMTLTPLGLEKLAKWYMTVGVLDDEKAHLVGHFNNDLANCPARRHFEFRNRCSRYVYLSLFLSDGRLLGHHSIDIAVLLATRANCYHGSCAIPELYYDPNSSEPVNELMKCHFRIFST